jgi:mono/diheme cytochrome c family protein
VWKAVLRWGLVALALVLLGIQFVPYGRAQANPAVTAEPTWNSPRTRELAARACFACHSNQTEWPWYSHVAPVSWLVQRDVEQGRRKVNFSEFDRPQRDARNAADQVQKGAMPQPYYVALHPEANLNPAEREELIQGLQLTLGGKR